MGTHECVRKCVIVDNTVCDCVYEYISYISARAKVN